MRAASALAIEAELAEEVSGEEEFDVDEVPGLGELVLVVVEQISLAGRQDEDTVTNLLIRLVELAEET